MSFIFFLVCKLLKIIRLCLKYIFYRTFRTEKSFPFSLYRFCFQSSKLIIFPIQIKITLNLLSLKQTPTVSPILLLALILIQRPALDMTGLPTPLVDCAALLTAFYSLRSCCCIRLVTSLSSTLSICVGFKG